MAIELPRIVTYCISYDNEVRPHKKIKGRMVRHSGGMHGIELYLFDNTFYRGMLVINGVDFTVTAIPLVPSTARPFEAVNDRATWTLTHFITFFEHAFFTPPSRVKFGDLECAVFIVPQPRT